MNMGPIELMKNMCSWYPWRKYAAQPAAHHRGGSKKPGEASKWVEHQMASLNIVLTYGRHLCSLEAGVLAIAAWLAEGWLYWWWIHILQIRPSLLFWNTGYETFEHLHYNKIFQHYVYYWKWERSASYYKYISSVANFLSVFVKIFYWCCEEFEDTIIKVISFAVIKPTVR